MPQFESNGASVHYELLGSGPPLLMIARIASWGRLLPRLA